MSLLLPRLLPPATLPQTTGPQIKKKKDNYKSSCFPRLLCKEKKIPQGCQIGHGADTQNVTGAGQSGTKREDRKR